MRRLLTLVSAVLFVESMFFAALSPLLPHYSDEFGLTKGAAGVLSAVYAAGGLAGALPGGLLAVRLGVKRALLIGIAVLAGSTAAFGFAGSVLVLDLTRFGQGFGSAIAWTAGLTWLIAAAPRDRRGEMIGLAMGAAIAGTLLGPVLGGAAARFGTGEAFGAVALIGAALGVWAALTPSSPPPRYQPLRALLVALRGRVVATGFWLVALAALLLGVISVLAPLRLDALGVGAVGISAVFLIAATVEAGLNPVLGRWSDRRGRLAPVRAGLLAAAGISLVVPWIGERWLLSAAVVAAGIAYSVFWVPGTALLSDGAEAAGVDQAYGFTLLNFAWAPGNVVGAAAGGAIAGATSDAAVYIGVAALCLLTLAGLRSAGAMRVAAPLAGTAPEWRA